MNLQPIPHLELRNCQHLGQLQGPVGGRQRRAQNSHSLLNINIKQWQRQPVFIPGGGRRSFQGRLQLFLLSLPRSQLAGFYEISQYLFICLKPLSLLTSLPLLSAFSYWDQALWSDDQLRLKKKSLLRHNLHTVHSFIVSVHFDNFQYLCRVVTVTTHQSENISITPKCFLMSVCIQHLLPPLTSDNH